MNIIGVHKEKPPGYMWFCLFEGITCPTRKIILGYVYHVSPTKFAPTECPDLFFEVPNYQNDFINFWR